jgi:hypothetical protein
MSDPLSAFSTAGGQTLRALARQPTRVAFRWPGGSITSGLRHVRDTLRNFGLPSRQQLIEPVAQLVLVIGFCQPRQIELGALGQFGITGREQDRQ